MPGSAEGTSSPWSPSPAGFWRRHRNRLLLGGLAIGLLLGAQASADRLGGLEEGDLPSLRGFLLALGFLVVGQLVVGYGWRRLAPELEDPLRSQWTFHATQPGKYLPLGVGQAVGQVALARDQGMAPQAAMAAWASHILMIVAGGVATGSLLVLRPDTGPIRWTAMVCVVAVALVHRPTLGRLVGFGARFTSRLPDASHLPAQRGLAEAFVAGVAFVVLHGTAFAVLLHDGDRSVVRWLALVGAYGLAVGVSTVTPLPAGLGLREGLLVLLVGGPAAVVLAAAIVLRVTTFAMEVGILACFWLVIRVRSGRPPRTEPLA